MAVAASLHDSDLVGDPLGVGLAVVEVVEDLLPSRRRGLWPRARRVRTLPRGASSRRTGGRLRPGRPCGTARTCRGNNLDFLPPGPTESGPGPVEPSPGRTLRPAPRPDAARERTRQCDMRLRDRRGRLVDRQHLGRRARERVVTSGGGVESLRQPAARTPSPPPPHQRKAGCRHPRRAGHGTGPSPVSGPRSRGAAPGWPDPRSAALVTIVIGDQNHRIPEPQAPEPAPAPAVADHVDRPAVDTRPRERGDDLRLQHRISPETTTPRRGPVKARDVIAHLSSPLS